MFEIETGADNEILRTKSTEVKPHEYDKYIKIGRGMLKYIKNPDNGGVGLRAPQIGINKRFAVVSLLRDWDDENFKTILMINPEILGFGDEVEVEEEGCLSLPETNRKDVKRYLSLKVTYIDDKKKKNTIIVSGTAAKVVQHEVDHLDAMLYIDRATEIKK